MNQLMTAPQVNPSPTLLDRKLSSACLTDQDTRAREHIEQLLGSDSLVDRMTSPLQSQEVQ